MRTLLDQLAQDLRYAVPLSATGLYGVLSFTIGQRTREIGIRMALGASASGVIRLRQVSALDGAAFAAALGFVTVAAVLAAYRPARRRTRIDPAEALRAE
jgi:putative ABC transport system permease protein